ncbi:MAG: ATP-binding protein [Planctomycetota bacterium]
MLVSRMTSDQPMILMDPGSRTAPLRYHSLQALGLVDCDPEPQFDRLTRLVQQTLKVPVALVSLVETSRDRQYFKSQQGLPEPWATTRQTPLSHSFCQHVVKQDEPLIVENAVKHDLVVDNLAIQDLGVIAYLGVPIYAPNSTPIGALCAIADKPKAWSEHDIQVLHAIADSVSDAIRLRSAIRTNQELFEEQQAFTYALSHDLKAPVNSIHSLLGELKNDMDDPNVDMDPKLIDLCLTVSGRMKAQIAGLSQFHALAENRHRLEPVSLSDVVLESLCGLRHSIHECQAEIDVEQLPEVVGVQALLVSVFQNLFDNAIKYRDESRRPSVKISGSSIGDEVEVLIRDNGIGIPSQFQHRVFEIFERLHSQADYEGTGLGLAICQRIMALHGGSIGLESEPNVGTTVSVRFKRNAA